MGSADSPHVPLGTPTPTVDELITSHMPLVGHIVRETMGRLPAHVNRDDLTSAGLTALVQAGQGFDAERGVPFARYAVLVAIGDGGGHLQSLIGGAVLLILSFLSVMLGIISDLIRTNRILIEANLEHTKRARFEVTALEDDDRDGPLMRVVGS